MASDNIMTKDEMNRTISYIYELIDTFNDRSIDYLDIEDEKLYNIILHGTKLKQSLGKTSLLFKEYRHNETDPINIEHVVNIAKHEIENRIKQHNLTR